MISNLKDMSEEQRNRIVYQIMHYSPSPEVRDKILVEVLRFKWFDCEKMGIDIYSEMDEEEQIIVAGFHWRVDHWQDFFKNNDTKGIDQPRDLSLTFKEKSLSVRN